MIGTFDPFAELSRLQDELSQVARATRRDRREAAFQPVVDIYEGKDAIFVKAELPGVRPDDVHIHVENNLLTLSGERKLESVDDGEGYHRVESTYGAFTRSFQLPNTVDAESIDASLDAGVLTLKLPKRAEAQPRKITVKARPAGAVDAARETTAKADEPRVQSQSRSH